MQCFALGYGVTFRFSMSSIRWSAPLPSWLNIFPVLSVFMSCLSLKSFQMTDVRIV